MGGSRIRRISGRLRTLTGCRRAGGGGGYSGGAVLAVLGDSVTTDHISPAGSIKQNGPAGKYLMEHGVEPAEFNSYGSRRGNHEVMVRGTFANVRLRNKMAPGTEGGVTRLLPEGTGMSIYDASVEYAKRGTPLAILAGKEYGSGSSRDWAAKGPRLLGIRFVIAESYERIHRSNLVGMGILPLQFEQGENAESLGLTGEEILRDYRGLKEMLDSKFAGGQEHYGDGGERDGDDDGVSGDGADRYAAGDSVLPAWGDFAVRAAAVGGEGLRRRRIQYRYGYLPDGVQREAVEARVLALCLGHQAGPSSSRVCGADWRYFIPSCVFAVPADWAASGFTDECKG